MYYESIAAVTNRVTENISQVIYGKQEKIRFVLTALLCGGHVLLDDIPGTGKTSLAKALARSIDADCKRIQFTPDLLPSDIGGINFFDQKKSDFVFRPGPIFTHILLADEINRTTPRTQSALLEAMQEGQTTIDGVTYPLRRPFFVLATQNPIESQGTFPLPEAQIDRFFMKLRMGYPDPGSEKKMLDEQLGSHRPLENLKPVCNLEEVLQAMSDVDKILVSDAVKEYIVDIVRETRDHVKIRLGISPRGTLALARAAQAHAGMEQRDFVLPDDVKAVALPVLAHRILSRSQNTLRITESNENIIEAILEKVPAPIA